MILKTQVRAASTATVLAHTRYATVLPVQSSKVQLLYVRGTVTGRPERGSQSSALYGSILYEGYVPVHAPY
jgi:hypothetical protein